MNSTFLDSNLYAYLVLPLLIFFARICDVTIGTIRIIYVSKGQKKIAPFLGFFEVFIWIVAISQIMTNLNNFVCYFGYAAGFATGNYVGLLVEEKLAVGNLMIRIITSNESNNLGKLLNAEGFGYTKINAQGSSGNVDIIYSIVPRTEIVHVLDIVKNFDPKIFYSIEDVRSVSSGIFPEKLPLSGINIFQRWRKGK